jgi:hypothetical protein
MRSFGDNRGRVRPYAQRTRSVASRETVSGCIRIGFVRVLSKGERITRILIRSQVGNESPDVLKVFHLFQQGEDFGHLLLP